jgi:hypothetical protein
MHAGAPHRRGARRRLKIGRVLGADPRQIAASSAFVIGAFPTSSDGLQFPLIESNDAVEAASEIEIVGGDERGETGAANEVEERIEHALAGRVIEVARWLVAEQEVGVIGEGADDRDPLLLATRQTGRPMLRTRGKTDLVEERSSPRSRPTTGNPGDHLRQHDVLES